MPTKLEEAAERVKEAQLVFARVASEICASGTPKMSGGGVIVNADDFHELREANVAWKNATEEFLKLQATAATEPARKLTRKEMAIDWCADENISETSSTPQDLPDEPANQVRWMLVCDQSGQVWLDFAARLTDAESEAEDHIEQESGWEPRCVVDLDTGESYDPQIEHVAKVTFPDATKEKE